MESLRLTPAWGGEHCVIGLPDKRATLKDVTLMDCLEPRVDDRAQKDATLKGVASDFPCPAVNADFPQHLRSVVQSA